MTARAENYKNTAMSQPQPKTKESDLIDTLNGLSLDDGKNPFILNRLAKQAQSLASVNPATSYVCQGIISFFQNKPKDVMRLFGNAIKVSPQNSMPIHNYAVTLKKMGFYKESLQYADTAYSLNHSNQLFHETALIANIFNGKFDTAHELLLDASKLRLNSDQITSANNILKFIYGNYISPADFVKLQDVAYDLLHSKHIFIMKTFLAICEDEDSMFLSYEMLLDKPVSEIVDLSVMLAEALAQESSLNDISGKINISFSPWCE